jgi:hypothetical protein
MYFLKIAYGRSPCLAARPGDILDNRKGKNALLLYTQNFVVIPQNF